MTPVLDEERLRTLSGGDDVIARELVDLLIEEAEPLIAGLRAAQDANDGAALRDATHALKGIAGNVGAAELCEAARSLETVVGVPSAVSPHLDAVVAAFRSLVRVHTSRSAA